MEPYYTVVTEKILYQTQAQTYIVTFLCPEILDFSIVDIVWFASWTPPTSSYVNIAFNNHNEAHKSNTVLNLSTGVTDNTIRSILIAKSRKGNIVFIK